MTDALTVLRELAKAIEVQWAIAKDQPGKVGYCAGIEAALDVVYDETSRLEREQAEANEQYEAHYD